MSADKTALESHFLPLNFENFTTFHQNVACANLAGSFTGEMFFFSLLLLTVYQRF